MLNVFSRQHLCLFCQIVGIQKRATFAPLIGNLFFFILL